MRLDELARRLDCRLDGDGALEIEEVRGLEDAGPRHLSFVADERAWPRLGSSSAGAVIVGEQAPAPGRPALRSRNPLLTFARALDVLHPREMPAPGVHPSAVIAPEARIDPTARIGPLVVVEAGAEVGPESILHAHVTVGRRVRIGSNCRIFPQVVLLDDVCLGDRVVVLSGAVIGSDGFGLARDGQRYVKIPQIGRVVIEDDVEIGANVAIDRATLGETRIARGTKIDNLVQIGHNVRVGADTVIVAQAGIAGSSRIGSRVTLAGQVGIVDHVEIGDDATVGAQAGVTKDIPPGAVMLGSPAVPHVEFKRQVGAVAGLGDTRKRLRGLEGRVAALEDRDKA